MPVAEDITRLTLILADAYRAEEELQVGGRRPIYECFAGFAIDYVIELRFRDALAASEL